MRWELSEEQVLFQDALRGWLEREAPPSVVRRDQDSGDPEAFERALTTEGWLGVGTPETLGGQGGGLVELALAAESLARSVAPSSAWLATVLAAPALAGRAELAGSVVEKGAFAACVVAAGSPPDVLPRGISYDGDRISGSVAGVLGADRVGSLIVAVQDGSATEPAPTLVLVDAADEGVHVTRRRILDRSRSVADVAFDHAVGLRLEVDASAVLAQAALRSAVLVAADALGAMSRMLEQSVEYSLQRKQFGVPIGSFQAIKHAAASMLVSVEAARSIVYFAAASVDAQAPDSALHAAAAKSQVCADAARTADTALTVHGAIGYTWEYDLQLLYKRAKLDAVLFGSTETWNERLASGLPLLPGATN